MCWFNISIYTGITCFKILSLPLSLPLLSQYFCTTVFTFFVFFKLSALYEFYSGRHFNNIKDCRLLYSVARWRENVKMQIICARWMCSLLSWSFANANIVSIMLHGESKHRGQHRSFKVQAVIEWVVRKRWRNKPTHTITAPLTSACKALWWPCCRKHTWKYGLPYVQLSKRNH